MRRHSIAINIIDAIGTDMNKLILLWLLEQAGNG